MKSERRHELQHNELAVWLVKSFETIKPYQNLILAGVAAVFVVMLGYTLWSRDAASRTSLAWDELNAVVQSRDPAKLAKISEEYPNSSVGTTAAIVAADNHLAEGCERLFVNKALAQQELTKATELYHLVLQQGQLPLELERATFGLARAEEAKGDLESAEKLYGEVAAKWPNGTFAAAANGRLQDLKRPTTKRFYDQFAHFDPKPAFTGKPGERPDFDLNSLPSDGPPSVSGLRLDTKEANPGGKGPAEAKKSPEKPAKK
jgi:predicted negative regulator of RcsB-dependent stress response